MMFCGDRPAQPHDIADHFGHRLVVLDRDRLVDLDGGMQRAGERRVLDDRDRMLAGDLAGSSRPARRRPWRRRRGLHAALILQGDRVMGRVGDDHRRLGHAGDHAPALPGLAHLLHLAPDDRIALALPELLIQFPQRHFLLLASLDEVVIDLVRRHFHHLLLEGSRRCRSDAPRKIAAAFGAERRAALPDAGHVSVFGTPGAGRSLRITIVSVAEPAMGWQKA